jgi:hypothetical protein
MLARITPMPLLAGSPELPPEKRGCGAGPVGREDTMNLVILKTSSSDAGACDEGGRGLTLLAKTEYEGESSSIRASISVPNSQLEKDGVSDHGSYRIEDRLTAQRLHH